MIHLNVFRTPIGAVVAATLLALAALPALGGPMVAAIPAPGALHYTTNVETCKANSGGNSFCERLATHNAVAFYASWQCNGCSAKGYKLKTPAPDSRVVDDSTKLYFIEMPPAGGWTGQCFAAVAYRELLPAAPVSGGRTSAQPASTYEESVPSAQACVTATRAVINVPASAERGYSRTYSVLYSNNVPQTQDGYNHTSDPMETGYRFIVADSFSQTNTFYRSAYSFKRTVLGDDTVFGGAFVFDGDGCSDLYSPAPSGWENAVWIKPVYGTIVQSKWSKGGGGASETVDDYVRAWHPGKALTFFLEPYETPEIDKSGLMPPSFTCVGMVSNVRLTLTVGVTK
jgi:hypothetical protein